MWRKDECGVHGELEKVFFLAFFPSNGRSSWPGKTIQTTSIANCTSGIPPLRSPTRMPWRCTCCTLDKLRSASWWPINVRQCQSVDWSIDWLIDWISCRMNDWVCHWLIDWLIFFSSNLFPKSFRWRETFRVRYICGAGRGRTRSPLLVSSQLLRPLQYPEHARETRHLTGRRHPPPSTTNGLDVFFSPRSSRFFKVFFFPSCTCHLHSAPVIFPLSGCCLL